MSGLVITRGRNEAFVIGTDIIVTVLSVSGGQVKIQIDAPRDVSVDRMEVHERKLAERAS